MNTNKKRGRPRMNEAEKASKHFCVYLTEHDAAVFREYCSRQGISASRIIRRLMTSYVEGT